MHVCCTGQNQPGTRYIVGPVGCAPHRPINSPINGQIEDAHTGLKMRMRRREPNEKPADTL